MYDLEESKRNDAIEKPHGQGTDGWAQSPEFLGKYFGDDKPPQRADADSEKGNIEKDQQDGQPFAGIAQRSGEGKANAQQNQRNRWYLWEQG